MYEISLENSYADIRVKELIKPLLGVWIWDEILYLLCINYVFDSNESSSFPVSSILTPFQAFKLGWNREL